MESQGLERLSAYVSEALQHGPKPLGLPSEDLITAAAAAAEEVLMGQPPLLRIPAPVTVCGDLFGGYETLWTIFKTCGAPPTTSYLFLGNYAATGCHGVETLTLLFALKALHPNHVFLLRGTHECEQLGRQVDGLFDQCTARFTPPLWRVLVRVFDCLPLACIVGGSLFCVHGGISPELDSSSQIDDITRPCGVQDTGLLCDLLWSQPGDDGEDGWGELPESVSFTYGLDIARAFLRTHGFRSLIRSTMAAVNGRDVRGDMEVVSISSCARENYSGNAAAMHVGGNMACTFTVFDRKE